MDIMSVASKLNLKENNIVHDFVGFYERWHAIALASTKTENGKVQRNDMKFQYVAAIATIDTFYDTHDVDREEIEQCVSRELADTGIQYSKKTMAFINGAKTYYENYLENNTGIGNLINEFVMDVLKGSEDEIKSVINKVLASIDKDKINQLTQSLS